MQVTRATIVALCAVAFFCGPGLTLARPTPTKNACAFTLSTSAHVDLGDNTVKTALAKAILESSGNGTTVDVQTNTDRVIAVFSGSEAGAVALSFCDALPRTLTVQLPSSVFGNVTVTDAVLGAAYPSPRSCYVYGYNLSRCGYGSPMFGCSETRDCYKYRRGRCTATRRVCRCGGSFTGGC